METAATTGVLETVVEQSQWPHGPIMCLRHLGWTWPHTCSMDVKAQARVDSFLARWKEWADERKELALSVTW